MHQINMDLPLEWEELQHHKTSCPEGLVVKSIAEQKKKNLGFLFKKINLQPAWFVFE